MQVDIIIAGAGLPLDLPSYLKKGSLTKLIPIVSSARATRISSVKEIFQSLLKEYKENK